jgi:hypothetical protein
MLSVLAVLLVPSRVEAEPEPYRRVLVQTELMRLICVPAVPPVTCRELPPGRFLDERSWVTLDEEQRRLQDQETRLTAENKSLRATASAWQPGWKTLTLTLAVGLAGGWYLNSRL